MAQLISATWFPERERTLATALMYEANIAGWMLCFVVPPALVPVDASEAEQRRGLVLLWLMVAAGAFAFFVAVCLHFPSKPRTPPSGSGAETTRLEFGAGVKQLAGSGQFWCYISHFHWRLGLLTGRLTGLLSDFGALAGSSWRVSRSPTVFSRPGPRHWTSSSDLSGPGFFLFFCDFQSKNAFFPCILMRNEGNNRQVLAKCRCLAWVLVGRRGSSLWSGCEICTSHSGA